MLDESTIIQAASQLLSITFILVFLFQYLLLRAEGKVKRWGVPFITAPIGTLFILSILTAFLYTIFQATWILAIANMTFIYGVCFMLLLSFLLIFRYEYADRQPPIEIRLGKSPINKRESWGYMKIRGLLLSKWFYYAFIALMLIVGMYVILPSWILSGIVSPELALNTMLRLGGLCLLFLFSLFSLT